MRVIFRRSQLQAHPTPVTEQVETDEAPGREAKWREAPTVSVAALGLKVVPSSPKSNAEGGKEGAREGRERKGGERKCGLSVLASSLLDPPHPLWGGFPADSAVKSPPAMQEMELPSLHLESGGGHGNPLQYSRLENPLDRGDWRPPSMGSQESGKTERLNVTANHSAVCWCSS